MAHKQKYTRGSVGHMLGHYGRTKEVPDLPMPANTALNYNLACNDQPEGQLDFLHQRLSEVKVHNRKDVNVMVDWVVTAPKGLSLADEERFFKESYQFLNDRYGRENVISAYVHMDEVTPHMHYAFVPVVEDRKNGGYKLSAKEAVTREDLRTFHGDLGRHLEKAFGRDMGVLNESTKEGNKSIAELKRGTAREELQAVKEKTTDIAEKAQNIIAEGRKAFARVEGFKKQEKALQRQIRALEGQLKATQMKINEITCIQPQRTLTGAIRGVSVEDIENLKQTAIVSVKALQDAKNLSQENDRLIRKCEHLEKQMPSMMDKMKDAKEKSRLLEIEKAFQKLPEDVQRQLLRPVRSQDRSRGFSHDR